VTLFDITHGERAGWQQRPARELANDPARSPGLADHRVDLGFGRQHRVVGHVTGPASPDQLRRAFDSWRTALLPCQPSEVSFRDGTVFLKATTHRNRVRVTLTATLPPHRDGEVTP
jgi:hypothetical protein